MKKLMYITGIVFLFLFVVVLILSFIFPEDSTYGSILGGCVIAGLCWLEIPTSTVPMKPLNLWKNTLKRFFQRFSMLPLYRAILYVVAVLMSTYSIIAIVLLVIDLVK